MLRYRDANGDEMIEEGDSMCHSQVARGYDDSNG